MTETERDAYVRYINDKYDLLIRKIANHIFKEDAFIEDVKQLVLIKLLPKVSIMKDMHPRQLAAYIGTTTKNEAITEFLKLKEMDETREKATETYFWSLYPKHDELHAFSGTFGFGEEVWALLMELPEMDRDLMVYKFYYGMTSDQIAVEFGTNPAQVKKRYQRARKKLIKLIERKGVELR